MSALVDAAYVVKIECGDCSIVFGLEIGFHRARVEDGRGFYCPNGHRIAYSESEVARLRSSLQKAQRAAIEARDERDAAERKAAAQIEIARNARTQTKREITKRRKIETLAANGICPFGCRRYFDKLRRHVASKHPAARRK